MTERKASMGDKVYRGDVVKFIRNNISLGTFMKRTVKTADEECWDLCDQLNYVPAIEDKNEPHWHPVSEMPEEDDDYLLLTHEKTKYGTFKRIIIGAWNSATHEWLEEYEGMYRDVNHPVAWISMQELLLLKGYEATE